MELFLKIEATPWVLESFRFNMAVSSARGMMGVLVSLLLLSEKFLRPSELRGHSAQFGHIRKHTVAFDRETGSQRHGLGLVFFTKELQKALQQENRIIDGVKIHVQAQK